MANREPGPSKFLTDWNKCCLCQTNKGEDLKSPRAKQPQENDGYTMIAVNIPQFYAINEIPIVLDPARLDDGCGIVETLRENKAQYHQSCRLMFNNTKLERVRKRKSERTQPVESQTKLRRTSLEGQLCFICDKESESSELRQVMTMNINNRLNQCAKTLNDGKLLSRLSGGDAIAQELKYHFACLTDLYNRERACLRAAKRLEQEHWIEDDAHPQAFSELVTYLVETTRTGEGPSVFKLADIVKLYVQRLEQLGSVSPTVNPTRLKEKLLSEIPELEAHNQGIHVYLAFQKDVGFVLSEASDYYSDALILNKAANILRRQMLDHKSTFDGAFHEGCIDQAIPVTLFQFVAMLEHGADIKSQIRFGTSKTDLAIAQLLQYNCFERYKEGAATHRHSKNRETPFPIYMGMSIYAKTQKRTLVDMLHEHGISISYDRVLEISAQLGDATVSKYVEDGVVCPPVLRKGLFTTSAMDNIDHNPTATTATTSFHGTSVSAFQHPTKDDKGEERRKLTFGQEKVKRVPELPDSFTNVRPAFFTKKPSPTQSVLTQQDPTLIRPQLAMEYEWLEKVSITDDPFEVTWSAHHASQKRGKSFEVSIASLLPLLRDQAHSVATVKHVMEKIKEIVDFLNPGQVPVIAADQPIYAVAKQVQWQWPEVYGEDKFVIMFGGLHIEMAALKSIGTLLVDSGWTGALVEGGIASPGTADSFLSASSITRTRLSHQITACSLYKLSRAAHTDYKKEKDEVPEEVLTFEAWCEHRTHQSPQFHFWYMVLSMELVILLLIRSFGEANFDLYCQSLVELIPYFFANNNVNYARWLPIHYRDMVTLEMKHPQLAEEFRRGNFVIHKSSRQFSAIAIDQAHGQANAVIKADGGVIGVTEDPSALRRWMIAGPKVSHLVEQYETECGTKAGTEKLCHHEESDRAQKMFLEKVEKLLKTMTDMGNPFQEESRDLLPLDTKDIAHHTAAELISTHLDKGKVRFHEFLTGLEKKEECTFYEPIKKNRTDFFRQVSASAESSKQKVLKEDCHLFSKLFISCQSRECDLKEFFRHENQSHPAALSDGGKLHTCQKSYLTAILESKVTIPEVEPDADTIIIDGAALVNCLPPRRAKSFEEYAMLDVLPTIQAYSSKFRRTDIVFDVYLHSSLKAEARLKRGHGVRRRVTREGRIPPIGEIFLERTTTKPSCSTFLLTLFHVRPAQM